MSLTTLSGSTSFTISKSGSSRRLTSVLARSVLTESVLLSHKYDTDITAFRSPTSSTVAPSSIPETRHPPTQSRCPSRS